MHDHISYEIVEENIRSWTEKEKLATKKEDKRHAVKNRLGWEQIRFEKRITDGKENL